MRRNRDTIGVTVSLDSHIAGARGPRVHHLRRFQIVLGTCLLNYAERHLIMCCNPCMTDNREYEALEQTMATHETMIATEDQNRSSKLHDMLRTSRTKKCGLRHLIKMVSQAESHG